MTGHDFLKDDLRTEFLRRGIKIAICVVDDSIVYVFSNIEHGSIRFDEVNFEIRNLLQTARIARIIADAVVNDTDSIISKINLGSCWDDISDLGVEWFLNKYDLKKPFYYKYKKPTPYFYGATVDISSSFSSIYDIKTPYRDFWSLKKFTEVKRIIFNGPATIVFWGDGTKTVVKCQEGDVFDEEKGFAMAFLKHALGNKANYNNYINKALKNADYQLDEDTFLLSKGFSEAIRKIFDVKEKEKK